MVIKFSDELTKEFIQIKKKDPILIKKIEKQLILFKGNPKHPSLRTHKLSGKLNNMWSISITMNIRMIYIQRYGDEAYFVDIGTHDQVYK